MFRYCCITALVHPILWPTMSPKSTPSRPWTASAIRYPSASVCGAASPESGCSGVRLRRGAGVIFAAAQGAFIGGGAPRFFEKAPSPNTPLLRVGLFYSPPKQQKEFFFFPCP